MADRWLLPPLWFDLCWEIGGFDEYPFPIKVRSCGDTLEERSVLKQQAMPQMQAAGLLAGDRLAPAFGQALAQIAKPGLWIEALWMADDTNPSPVRVMSIAMERNALLFVQQPGDTEAYGGDIQITVHPNTSIASAAVQAMPPVQPGNRPRLAALQSDLAPKNSKYDGHVMQSFAPRGEQRTVKAIHDILSEEPLRRGQFTANLRDQMGRSHRSPVFTFFDAFEPDGRYGVTEQNRPGQGKELVIAPAGPADIGKALDNRVNEVRAEARTR